LIYKPDMSLNRVLMLSKVWPLPIPMKACSKKDNMATMLNISNDDSKATMLPTML